jgi:tetratricopeptide (TPR) repeat protein
MKYIVVLIALGLAAYRGSFDGPFIFDDRPAIVDNTTIRAFDNVWNPPAGSTVSGRPIANLSFALNYANAPATDANVSSYHAVNLLLHIASALLVFGIARRVADVRLAFAIAAIWIVHPLTTGAVTYIVQRVESLMSFFYLLTLYCAIRGWTAAAIGACALGMGTKEAMASAPIAVWLWDVVFASAPWNPFRNRRRRTLYVGLAATWIVLALAILSPGAQSGTVLQSITRSGAVEGWTPLTYLWTQAGVIVHYLRLAIFPSPLVFDYYDWPQAQSPADVWPALLFVVGLFAATIIGLIKRHPLGFLGACFFLILAPTSSLFPVSTEIAAEHRMYLPLLAVIAVVTSTAFALLRTRVAFAAVALVVIVAAGVYATDVRNADYDSEQRIWADTVAKRPANVRARINYGITLMREQRYAEAESQMRSAIAGSADRLTLAQAHLQLGSALLAQQKFDEGVAHMERALELDASIKEADVILGQAYSDRGAVAMALFYLRRAISRIPDNAAVLNRTAWLLATAPPEWRNPAEAVSLAERAVRITGGQDIAPLETLGVAYGVQGRYAEAINAAERALALARMRGDASTAAALERQIAFYRANAR